MMPSLEDVRETVRMVGQEKGVKVCLLPLVDLLVYQNINTYFLYPLVMHVR